MKKSTPTKPPTVSSPRLAITRRCPFCYSTTEHMSVNYTGGWYYVMCSFCMAKGSMSTVTGKDRATAERIGIAEATWDWNHASTRKVWESQEESQAWYAKRLKYVKKYAEGGKP